MQRTWRAYQLAQRFSSACRQSNVAPSSAIRRTNRNPYGSSSALCNAESGSLRLMSSAVPQRAVGQGFSYPGPRQLKDIVKLPLLNAHGAQRVREIWMEFHKDHKSAIADILNADEYGTLMQRTQRCPIFVLPVPRDGGYFTILLQFQGKHCLLTYLEDYKVNPSAAVPYATVTIFDELVEKKGLALLRGEVTNNLSREEAERFVNNSHSTLLSTLIRSAAVTDFLRHVMLDPCVVGTRFQIVVPGEAVLSRPPVTFRRCGCFQ